MTPEQFTYWLQGFVELHGSAPNDAQWQMIREHLKTVFHKVTPQFQQTHPAPWPGSWPAPPLTPQQPQRIDQGFPRPGTAIC